MMALLDGGAAGLIAGGVTFAVCEAAGSSGRTGSVESFAFVGRGSEGSAPFAVESPAEVAAGPGICFFSGAFAGLAAARGAAGCGKGTGGIAAITVQRIESSGQRDEGGSRAVPIPLRAPS